MSNNVTLAGSLTAGPSDCGGCGPGALLSMGLQFKNGCCGKSYNVATAAQPRTINSPSSYVAMNDIGPSAGLTHADTLVVQTSAPMLMRLTTDDGTGSSVLSVIPVDGLFIAEFQAARFLKLLEFQGIGTVSYFASGQS